MILPQATTLLPSRDAGSERASERDRQTVCVCRTGVFAERLECVYRGVWGEV